MICSKSKHCSKKGGKKDEKVCVFPSSVGFLS